VTPRLRSLKPAYAARDCGETLAARRLCARSEETRTSTARCDQRRQEKPINLATVAASAAFELDHAWTRSTSNASFEVTGGLTLILASNTDATLHTADADVIQTNQPMVTGKRFAPDAQVDLVHEIALGGDCIRVWPEL
jgi:hypothetical protein